MRSLETGFPELQRNGTRTCLDSDTLFILRSHMSYSSLCAALCSVFAAYFMLIEASAADAAVHADDRPFADGLVSCLAAELPCLHRLSLPPSSRVAGRCPPSFRPSGGAEAEALLG
jgi:hypothetical protein